MRIDSVLSPQPNKPKGDGRNKSKKIPRQAGNTREKHRQLAIAHGEYIAPQSQYRTPMNQVNEVGDLFLDFCLVYFIKLVYFQFFHR